MNPANFPSNVGAGNVMQQPEKGKSDAHMLLKHVGQIIQAQGPFTGWRQSVPIQERVMKVYQMISSLRLISKAEIPQVINAALKFEERAFREAKEKADYEKGCTEKLMQIRDRRQQAAITQSNQQNSVPMGLQNQNQMQQMGINSVQRPPVMNQQQQLVNASHPQPGRQQTFFQTPEGRQIPGPPLRDDINTLSPKDYQQVCQLAEQIAQKTSPADLEKIKQNLQNMTSEQRLLLERKGLTPLEYFFRCQALKNIRKFKSAAHMNMASPQPLNVNPANPSELMAAHQRQMNQPPMQFQGTPTMPMAGLEATFGGGFDQLHGQQMDPHRSQAPGHPAIPAPNPSMMNQMSFNPQHNPFQGGQPNMLAQQQHRQNLQNAQQEKMQQAAHFQAQSDAQARAQAAAKAQRAISSQATPMVPQTMPQQSPINPMLNQPISHMQIPPGGMTPQNRQFSRPPGMGQNPNVMQTPRPALPPGIPPGLQNQLAQLPPDQANAMLQNYRRAANNPAMLRQNPALSVQHQLQDPAQVRQGPGANMAVDPNMRGPVGMSHPMANMGGMPPQPGMQSQQFTVQKPGQQPMGFQQQPDPRFQYAQPRNNLNFTMNEDQIREMDRAALPNALLTSNPTLAQVLPKSLRTWGQLKMWASKNPQGLGDVSMEKLAMLQKVHFSQILQARREAANRGMAQPGQVPMGTDQNGFRQPPFNPQGPTQLPQQFPGQPPVPMPVMRPVTATDVQLARQKIGAPVEKLSDDALRSLLEKNRHKHYIAHMTRARDAGQPFTQIPNQVPAPGQVPAPLQQQQFPASQPPAPISQPGPTPGMPAKNMVLGPQTGASAARAPIMKEPQKSLKRPSDSEPEVPVSLSQPQISPSQTIPTQPSRPTPPQPTPEQLAAMNPQQRAQWEAHMRRQQQGPPRQTITKAAAEAAWSRMPDHLKQMYEEIAIKDRASPTYPAAMTSAESAAFAQQLRENTDMLSRMDALVQFYAKMVGQDQMIQRLLQMRFYLMKQFKGPDWTFVDRFTMTPQYLVMCINFIKRAFADMILRVQKMNQPPRPASAQPLAGQPASQQGPAPLNASNLQQLEQQQAALQRAKDPSQSVPPAPTTMQPPFPLGATSPQGVPRVYGPTSVTQETLTLPPPKRRKPNQAGNKAAGKAAPQTPSQVQGETPTTAQAKKPEKPPQNNFKCAVVECQHHLSGFPTQAALDTHSSEEHKLQEAIANAPEFLLESLRTGFSSADSQMKSEQSMPKPARDVSGAKPQAPRPQVKTEGATPASQQVAQSSTVAGMKTASPAPLQAKPSQASKESNLAAVSQTLTKGKIKTAATDIAEASPFRNVDSWSNMLGPIDTASDTFHELAESGFFMVGWSPADELLAYQSFTEMRRKETTQSTDASAQTQHTPQSSEGDSPSSNEGENNEDDWFDLLNLPEDVESTLGLSNVMELDANIDGMEKKDTDA